MEKRDAQHKVFSAKAHTDDGAEGTIKVAFAQLDVVDHDGDITRPGAFPNKEVALHVQHDGYSQLPVGKGRIREEDGWAVLEGNVNLDLEAGRDFLASVKFQGDIQEWSYGYFVSDSEPGDGKSFLRELKALDVYEVSAVTAAAGKDTRTLEVKNRDNTINLIETLADDGDDDAVKFLAVINAEGDEAEGMKFVESADALAKRANGLIERATEIRKLRSEKGRELGEAAVAALKEAHTSMSSLLDAIDEAPEPDRVDGDVDPSTELLRYERTRAQLAGHI